jgi:hypothetical protein
MKPALTSSATRGFAWKPLDTDWNLPSGESLAGFALDRGLLASSLLGAAQHPSDEPDSRLPGVSSHVQLANARGSEALMSRDRPGAVVKHNEGQDISGSADRTAKSARREPGHERNCVGGRR